MGFTENEKELLFKEFGKVERYGNKMEVDDGGLGMGEYIIKKIMEQYGGYIHVESDGRNKGATFTIKIPTK